MERVTALFAPACECTYQTSMGEKKPTACFEHGNRYVLASSYDRGTRNPAPSFPTVIGASAPRRRTKRSEPKRDWSLAITKVEEEGCCRICKRTDRKLDASHVLGREHDEPKVGADGRPLKELFVHPDRIIPACGPFPEGCHGAMHRHEVDVLQNLTLDEQLQAVKDAGSIEAAHIRLTAAPSAYVESLAS